MPPLSEIAPCRTCGFAAVDKEHARRCLSYASHRATFNDVGRHDIPESPARDEEHMVLPENSFEMNHEVRREMGDEINPMNTPANLRVKGKQKHSTSRTRMRGATELDASEKKTGEYQRIPTPPWRSKCTGEHPAEEYVPHTGERQPGIDYSGFKYPDPPAFEDPNDIPFKLEPPPSPLLGGRRPTYRNSTRYELMSGFEGTREDVELLSEDGLYFSPK